MPAYPGIGTLGSVYANLTGANLTRANLTRANLTDANLTGANLIDANLTRANLTRANLTRANLTRANLTRARGMGGWYATVRADLFKVLDTSPTEVPALLEKLSAGGVDGSVYEGDCACLVGTLAKAAGLEMDEIPTRDTAKPGQLAWDENSPAEVFFGRIHPGDTPSNSPDAALASVWIREWQAAQVQSTESAEVA